MPNRTTTRLLVLGGVLSAALLGLVGVMIAGEVALLLMPSPTTVKQQAWRVLALTALTTGLIAGVVGGVVFGVANLLNGSENLSQSIFGCSEGGILIGAPGLIVGALVGSVLALSYQRRAHNRETPGDATGLFPR